MYITVFDYRDLKMTTEKWHADIEITEELVRACLQQQFPELPLHTLKCIGEGWDNKVFLVNDEIIFRFPRREIAVEGIVQEQIVLTRLQGRFDIAIPNPEFVGHASPAFPYPFLGYRMIKGHSGCHAHLTEEQRLQSLPVLAKFLKQLHAVDEEQALALGAKPQFFDRAHLIKLVDDLNERVNKINERKICVIDTSVYNNEVQAAQAIELPAAKCLVQGDLYCRHLFFDQGKLTGIIDWGDLGINNRSVDLAAIWSFYPSSCHQQFFELYGAVDLPTWHNARFIALYVAITLVWYGDAIGDNLLVQESIDAIKRVNPKLMS